MYVYGGMLNSMIRIVEVGVINRMHVGVQEFGRVLVNYSKILDNKWYLQYSKMFKKRNRSQITQQFQLQSKNSEATQLIPYKEPNIQAIPQANQQKVKTILKEDLDSHKKQQSLFTNRPYIYIDPMSPLATIWAFIVIMAAYFMMFLSSLTLGFGPKFWTQQISQSGYLAGYLTLLILLFGDMVVRFNKGFYAFGSGKVIDDWGLIIKHYLKYFFWIDLIAIICLIIPLFESQFYLNFLQLLPMTLLYLKKFKCQDQIINALKYNRSMRNFFILTMLGCDIMLIGSFGACIFVGLDLLLLHLNYYGNNPQYYWLSNDSSYPVNLVGGDWVTQYIFAQSFSSGTLSTLAPGPFAKNPIQIVYAIILMTFFMLLASYAGEVLIQVLYSYEQIRIFHEKNIQKFDQFMILKGVSDQIRKKVHNFFELIWEVEVKMNVELQKQTINKFPLSIQEQLYLEMGFCRYARIFDNFSTRAIIQKQVSMKIISEVVDEGTNIFQARSIVLPQDRCMYYLKSGLCKFYHQHNEKEYTLALSNVQKTVGQYQFITGISYSYSCKSIDLCVIEKIQFSDLIAILQANELTEQLYCLRYQLLMEQRLDLISKKCIICEENHFQDKCGEVNIGNKLREDLRESGGVLKVKRKNKDRRSLESKKILGRDEKMRKIVPAPSSVFKRFKILGNMILDISKTEKQIEKLHQFSQYFPEFNL